MKWWYIDVLDIDDIPSNIGNQGKIWDMTAEENLQELQFFHSFSPSSLFTLSWEVSQERQVKMFAMLLVTNKELLTLPSQVLL